MAPNLARRRPAVSAWCPDPTSLLYVQVLDSTGLWYVNGMSVVCPGYARPCCAARLDATFVLSRSVLHAEGSQRQKSVVPLVGRQETENASRPDDEPVMNRMSTAGFVYPSVCIGIRLFVLLGRCSGDIFSMLL